MDFFVPYFGKKGKGGKESKRRTSKEGKKEKEKRHFGSMDLADTHPFLTYKRKERTKGTK